MTTPRVIELPRRMEALSADTFIGDAPVAATPARPEREQAVVLPFRPRAGRRRSRPARHAPTGPVVVPYGDDAA